MQSQEFQNKMLAWYDAHRRDLPWRAGTGEVPNPYHVWLSEVMLQQTTVPAVKPYFEKFLNHYPTIRDLAAAPTEDVMRDWAGLGYYSRARNLHKCAQVVVNEYDGAFPESYAELKKLPGIGDYTAAAITAIAFNRPANVVDGNIERVMARFFAVTETVPKAKPHLKDLAAQMAEGCTKRPGDYAQALMDLGAGICTPKSPKCMLCPVHEGCAGYKKGIAETLPRREKKGDKPKRYGTVYWIEKDGKVLLERRPDKGLLGGMVGLPTSAWTQEKPSKKGSIDSVHHVFTHFSLELLCIKEEDVANTDGDYFWHPIGEMDKIGFPTVFKKAASMFTK